MKPTSKQLGSLADEIVLTHRGLSRELLAAALNDYLKVGHSVLGGLRFRQAPKKTILCDEIIAAQRRFKRAHEPSDDSVQAILPDESINRGYLEQLGVHPGHCRSKSLTTAICPLCSNQTHLIYIEGRDEVKSVCCEKCLQQKIQKSAAHPIRIIVVYYPAIIASDKWGSKLHQFTELREFIDACLGSDPSLFYQGLTTHHRGVIGTLIEILKSFDHQGRIQKHAVNRLRLELRIWRPKKPTWNPDAPVARVSWKLLRTDDKPWEAIQKHYGQLQQRHRQQLDFDRLQNLYALGPSLIFVGLESFEGYVVFVFDDAKTAILDCPRIGNALYFMDSEKWKDLSKMSKTELLTGHPQEVNRLIHGSAWLDRVKRRLEVSGRRRNTLNH